MQRPDLTELLLRHSHRVVTVTITPPYAKLKRVYSTTRPPTPTPDELARGRTSRHVRHTPLRRTAFSYESSIRFDLSLRDARRHMDEHPDHHVEMIVLDDRSYYLVRGPRARAAVLAALHQLFPVASTASAP